MCAQQQPPPPPLATRPAAQFSGSKPYFEGFTVNHTTQSMVLTSEWQWTGKNTGKVREFYVFKAPLAARRHCSLA